MKKKAESTTLGQIIGIDQITAFFEASFLPIRWRHRLVFHKVLTFDF